MTTEEQPQTVRDRVLQAVAHGYELLDELAVAAAEIRRTKTEEDELRRSIEADEGMAQGESIRQSALDKIEKAHAAAIKKADGPWQAAQATHNSAVTQATNKHNKAVADAEERHTSTVESIKTEQELKLATAHSTVYRAQQEVAAVKATIDQNKKHVQETLGIDLSLLVVGEG